MMTYMLAPNPARLKIWQQNLNKSNRAQFDLINVPLHKDWDLLLLQEPYIATFGNTKANSQWHTIYPTSHLTDNTTNRSVILVNTEIDMNAWAQVPFEGMGDMTVIQFSLPQGQFTIFNIYNDCKHSNTLVMLWHFIKRSFPTILTSDVDHMLWCGNFNCHHSMWDKEHHRHLLTASASAAAQPLISLLEDLNMVMLLPKNIPMLQSMVTKNWTQVDNVFATENLAKFVVVCDMEPRQ